MEVELKVEYRNSEPYSCDVESLTPPITYPGATIKAVNGIHQQGKSNADVKELRFEGKAVNFIPRGLNLFFPNLTRLWMVNCGLNEISREDLVGLEKLEVLYLDENELTTLPDDLFVNMPKLNFITFQENKLEYLSSKLLQPIMKNGLECVDFQENVKIDAFFWPGCKGSMNSIKKLVQIIDAKCSKPIAANSSNLQTQKKLLTQHEKKFCDGFEKLLSTGKFSDFVIIVNGSKEFRVHKTVLAIQSVGFAEIFAYDENASELKIEDLSPESVEEFLRFLYTGKLETETKNAFEIFALASKLKVPELKSMTEETILSNLDDKNAFKVFKLGHRYASESFKTAAFEEIRKMFPDKKLADSLVESPKKVNELIETKLKFESIFQELNLD